MPTVSAMGDPISVVHDHAVSNVHVLANDTNTNSEPLVATLKSGPSHAASYSLASDGLLAYTPETHFVGADYITYEASSNGETSQATITIEVTNQTPWLMGRFLSMGHDHTLTDVDLLANASDSDGDQLQLTIVTAFAHVTVSQDSTGLWNLTPEAGWTGTDWMYAAASDGIASSWWASYSLTVTNAAPVAVGATYDLGVNESVNMFLQSAAVDDDGDHLAVSIVQGPNHATVAANADGSYAFTPETNWTGSDSFVVSFNDGLANSSTTTTITVNVAYETPIALPQTIDVNGSEATVITLAGFSAQGSNLTYSITQLPGPGALYDGPDDAGHLITSADLASGSYEIADSLHRVFFVPSEHAFGEDLLSFVVDDGTQASETALIGIGVLPGSSAPRIDEVALDLPSGDNLPGIDLLSYVHSTSTSLTITIQQPDHGSLSLDAATNLYVYSADPAYTGPVKFSFEASDGVNHTLAIGTVFVGSEANRPLSATELTRLQTLAAMRNRTGAQQTEMERLFDRMARRGIQFNGTAELQILEGILQAGQRAAGNNNRLLDVFYGYYRRGVGGAISGLQAVNEARYRTYRTARWGGAPHDEAWTWNEGGDTARQRYGLERLMFISGANVPGWEQRSRTENFPRP